MNTFGRHYGSVVADTLLTDARLFLLTRCLLLYVHWVTYFYRAAFSMSSDWLGVLTKIRKKKKPLRSCRRFFVNSLRHSACHLQGSARHHSARQTFTHWRCGAKLLLLVWLLLLLLSRCVAIHCPTRFYVTIISSEMPSMEIIYFIWFSQWGTHQALSRGDKQHAATAARLRWTKDDDHRCSITKSACLVACLKTDLDNRNGFDCVECHIAIQRHRLDVR